MTEPVDVVDLMRNLTARFIQYNYKMQVLLYYGNCKSNPVISAKDIPSEVDDFRLCVPNAAINQMASSPTE